MRKYYYINAMFTADCSQAMKEKIDSRRLGNRGGGEWGETTVQLFLDYTNNSMEDLVHQIRKLWIQ